MEKVNKTPINLDPENMDDFRALAHHMVDDLVDYVAGLRDRPVWKPILDQNKDQFTTPLPHQAQGEIEAYQDFKDQIFYKPMGNTHPPLLGMGNGQRGSAGCLC